MLSEKLKGTMFKHCPFQLEDVFVYTSQKIYAIKPVR